MYLSDFLLLLVFIAFLLYRFYRKQKAKKNAAKVQTAVMAADSSPPLPVAAYDNDRLPIHRVDVVSVDFDKTAASTTVADSVQCAISDYFSDIDAHCADRPTDIKFFTNYNRIFVVFVWC